MFEVVSHDGARYHFSKRFSEFEAMRKQSRKYGKLPLLPPKGGLFGKVGMNQTRVHKRYVALGKWLAACLEHMQTSSDDPGGRSPELCELFFDFVSANQAPTPSVRARQIFYHEENAPPENGSAAAKRVVSVAEESKRRPPVRGHGLSDAERRLQNRARGHSRGGGGGGGGGKRGGKRGRGGSSGDGDGDGEYDEEDEEEEEEDEDDDSGFDGAETKTTRGTPPPADLLSPLKSPATEIERKREAPLPLDPVAFEAWKVKVRAWKNDLRVRVSEDREEMVSRLQLQVKQWRATMRKRATSAIEGYQAKAAEESQKRQHLQKKMEIAKVRYSDMQRRLSDVESEGFNATVTTAATAAAAAAAAAAASKGGGPTLEVAVRAAHTQKDRADRAVKELQQARREVAALRGRVKELEGGGAQLLKERDHLKEEVAFLRQRGTVRNTPPSSSFLSPTSSSASSSNSSSSSSSTLSRPIPLKTSPATTKPTKHRLSAGRRREAKGEPEDGNGGGGGGGVGVDEGEGGSVGRGVSDGRPPRANSTSGVPTKNRSLRFSRHNVASRRAVSASVGSAAARNVMRSNSADEGIGGGVVGGAGDNGGGVRSKPSAHHRNKSHSGLRGELEREEDLGAAVFGVEEEEEAEVAAEKGVPQTRTREKEDEEGEGEEENLPVSGWIEAKAEDGRTYYYHKQTRRVRWEKPEGEVAGRIEKRLHDEQVEAERRQKEKVKRLRKRREEQEALDAATRGLAGVESKVSAWAKGKRLPYLLANLCTILEELAAPPAGAGSPPLNSSDKTLLLPPAMMGKCQGLRADSEYAKVHNVYIRVLRLLHPDKLALAPLKSRLTAQKLFSVLTSAQIKYANAKEAADKKAAAAADAANSRASSRSGGGGVSGGGVRRAMSADAGWV